MPVIAVECPLLAEIQVVPRKFFRPEHYARGVFVKECFTMRRELPKVYEPQQVENPVHNQNAATAASR